MGRIRSLLTTTIFLIIFLEIFANISLSNGESTSPWTTEEPMPVACGGFKAVVVDSTIYLFHLNQTYAYNPPNWTVKTSMLTPRGSFALAAYQNKIYCIGGATNFPSSVNEVYDSSTDTWTSKAPMPTARLYIDANVVDGKIYVISGDVQDHRWPNLVGNYELSNVTEVYDIATDTWTTKAPIPNATSKYASAVVDDKIYIIEKYTQIYDTKTDTWSVGAPPPHSVDFAACAAIQGLEQPCIFVIGGRRDEGLETSYNQIYNVKNDSWSFGTALPTARYDMATAVLDGKIYTIGGTIGSFYNIAQLNVTEMYDLQKDPVITLLVLSSASPIPASSSPTPSVPEFPTLVIVPLLLSIFSAVLVRYRKTKSRPTLMY